jgi:hypothetical protein
MSNIEWNAVVAECEAIISTSLEALERGGDVSMDITHRGRIQAARRILRMGTSVAPTEQSPQHGEHISGFMPAASPRPLFI